MANQKQILHRFYLVVAMLFVFAIAVGFKLMDIQFVHGDEYEELVHSRVFKNFTIPANRGNIYDANGNLLATSVPKYDIRFDAMTVSQEDFDANLQSLSDSLSNLLGKSKSYYLNRLKHARQAHNRYLLIARNLGYADYMAIKSFPLFEKGPYQGGFIAEQRTVRELPLGKIAERTVGHDQAGLEGAFNEYLKGKDGRRLKQKISNGLWKPISDANEVEPRDGQDVYTTIDVNMQDIVHHALLRQLEKFKADHGTAVLMEVHSGEIKAMANLGRTSDGKYYEKRNYAVWETFEPGSTFKLMTLVAALEDKVVDTSTVFDSEGGKVKYYDRTVYDSHVGGYGKISVARAFEVSSNTVFSKIATEGYKDNAAAFINRLDYMGLNQKIGLQIKGEGQPVIPHPNDKNWYGTTLPWMSFGYGVTMTPLQILMFYNAIANDGIEVKPRFIKEIRDRDKLVEHYGKTIVNNSVCSKKTAKIAQKLMFETVEKGTANGIYLKDLPLAGKTGTAMTNYGSGKETEYVGSFAGFFPADNPQYSCIVVVSKPDKSLGIYGSQVAAPAFQEIADRIYRRTPRVDTINSLQVDAPDIAEDYKSYFTLASNQEDSMPDVKGLSAMDAVSLLENKDIKVHLTGMGTIVGQSIPVGQSLKKYKSVNLEAH